MTKATGWIDWTGGDCPVKPGDFLKICNRAGQINIATAEVFDWKLRGKNTDIIGYQEVVR